MAEQTSLATLMATQPIFDRHQKMVAAELLYRSDDNRSVFDVGEKQATTELLYNLGTGITEQISHFQTLVFINVSADFLMSRAFLPVPPENVVIELVERIEPTQALVESVRHWYQQGFRFALDDFEFKPSWHSLLDYASYIKVDTLGANPQEVLRKKDALSHYPVAWLAERVETKEEYEIYYDAGFELFQGYYFAKPSIIYGKVLPPSSLQFTRILSALSNQNVGISELAEMVSADPNLAFKLLKIANSPLYRGHLPVESVHDVISRLGLDYLRRWMLIFGVLKDSTREHAELILTRAHLCELLTKAHQVRGSRGADAYLVGLMSGVDLLLKIDPSTFIESVNVSKAIADAVVNETGILGKQLKLARKIERCVMLKHMDVLEPSWLELYCQARRHAVEVVKLSETL
ncbi:HDOD domain-containing protein [Halomonas sp. XH26]|uniref:EAL and HDOD domain-containing protein n=1 Tax=unclassified Halomonas TaxID=2609666 RepID=UPI000214E5D8|nr:MULTISPECIES: HDOD domain-containing protein [unclassified Halomonas]EGP18528.1 intracellular signaling protein (EAL-mHD-GYP) [Halomonas sp. TD01]UTA81645.1 HDOD domain-containing protein [Halomonas sp. XH26]CAH1044576.1 hypothetical protein HPTD01_3054 [Halomonas sp. TD01]